MCGFILYIFIYISQIFRTASPFLKTQEEKNKQKQNLVLQFTLLKKLKKKQQIHIVQFNIFNVCDGVGHAADRFGVINRLSKHCRLITLTCDSFTNS